MKPELKHLALLGLAIACVPWACDDGGNDGVANPVGTTVGNDVVVAVGEVAQTITVGSGVQKAQIDFPVGAVPVRQPVVVRMVQGVMKAGPPPVAPLVQIATRDLVFSVPARMRQPVSAPPVGKRLVAISAAEEDGNWVVKGGARVVPGVMDEFEIDVLGSGLWGIALIDDEPVTPRTGGAGGGNVDPGTGGSGGMMNVGGAGGAVIDPGMGGTGGMVNVGGTGGAVGTGGTGGMVNVGGTGGAVGTGGAGGMVNVGGTGGAVDPGMGGTGGMFVGGAGGGTGGVSGSGGTVVGGSGGALGTGGTGGSGGVGGAPLTGGVGGSTMGCTGGGGGSGGLNPDVLPPVEC